MQSRICGPILRSVFRVRPSSGDIYYKSQINVIAAKLKTSDGQKLYAKIVTADSFRNSYQDIIVADIVSVKSYLEGPADKRGALDTDKFLGEEEASAERLDSKDTRVFNKVTRYMRDAHRLYILLTRAKKGLIISCHLPTLLSTTKLDKAKNEKALLQLLPRMRSRGTLSSHRPLLSILTLTRRSSKIISQPDNEKYKREQNHARTVSDIVHNRWNPYSGEAKRKMHQKG